MEILMKLINAVKDAIGMAAGGEFTTGNLLVLVGLFLLVVGVLMLVTSLGRNARQRSKMIKKLQNNSD